MIATARVCVEYRVSGVLSLSTRQVELMNDRMYQEQLVAAAILLLNEERRRAFNVGKSARQDRKWGLWLAQCPY